MKPYKLYQSDLIINNHQSIIQACDIAQKYFEAKYNTSDSTWRFMDYNIFNLTSSSLLFWKLFKELNYHIRSYIGDDRPLWLQAWLNYHSYSELESKLGYHHHDSPYHGYISIDPQDTTTIFEGEWEITNRIGQIYIGPSGKDNKEYYHRVENNSFYKNKRITIGFNIQDIQDTVLNISHLPLL